MVSSSSRAPLNEGALAELLARPTLRRLLEALNGDGEETRIVGGAIRNALLDRPVTEVDCATTALPDITMQRAKAAGLKPVPTGIDHGTVTIVVEGEPFEVTTLREDVETDGRRAVVRFGRDFRADAQRRDFTINALSLGLDGRLHDFTNGLVDLEARRVRFIGKARIRIREDYLRILRFFRFHSEYANGAPDQEGLHAASAERSGLDILSRERIRAEFLKLLVTRRARDAVGILFEHGFLTSLLGGVVEQGRFARTVEAPRKYAAVENAPVERLAALAVMTREDAERLRERLRLSNDEYERLAHYGDLLAILKTCPIPLGDLAVRRLVAEHGVDAFAHAVAATAGEPQPIMQEQAAAALARFAGGAEPVPVFPLRGADLIAGGIPKGPRIGQLLAFARQTWLAEGCPAGEVYARDLVRRVLASA